MQTETPTPLPPSPSVFEFTDYRELLRAFYQDKKRRNPNYNQSLFARKAGLGANSRGYLKLVIEGKRNLTPHTSRAFIDALGLRGKDALYFENLVNFNQARTSKDKDYYFERLSASAQGSEGKQFEILKSQYSYCSNWYLVAVRELVALADFREDASWIAARLRNKISKKQATDALEHLLKLGMIARSPAGTLIQTEPLIKFSGGVFSSVIQKLHGEMLDRAKESLIEDEYQDRAASFVTLSCSQERFPEIKKMVDEFRDQLTVKFGIEKKAIDSVCQIGFQIFQLTSPRKLPTHSSSQEISS